MDTLHFVKLKCPNKTDTSYAANDSGMLTNARISFLGIKPSYEVGEIMTLEVKHTLKLKVALNVWIYG
ncbi:MAG TPA: hypothetical protein DCM38_07665 [Gammaproteobacteria bacterium]|nr:hypothetical protein [Gammaproteobacteria bacterium]